MDRRAAGALLALAACFACSAAAPTASNQTALDLYEGTREGCYYNFQHYGEGDRIMTNEPCLNCTCHNRMLMCYLRVCPFTKAIGQDCTVEKRADQCCPIVTCPDVPVDLLTSTSTTSPAEYGATGLGKLDKYGCSISGKYFPEGSKVPPTPNKPCEHCYCIRNMTTCVMQECTLHVDGCTPIYHKDVCCPVRYSCDHPEDEVPLLDDMSTTVRPTPGFLLTTTTISPVTQMTQDCVHDDRIFSDGALIKTEKACEHCYCMKGDIVCVVQECGAPMENEGKNCTSLPPREGQCCPDTYICEGDELTSDLPTEFTTEPIIEKLTTLTPPRRTSIEGSGYRNEPDQTPYTDMPIVEPEVEGSGEEDTSKPLGPDEIIPTPGDDDQYIYVTTKGPAYEEYEKTTAVTDKDMVPDMKDKTVEPHVSTNAPISEEKDKFTTTGMVDEEISETHKHIPTTKAPEMYDITTTTELGDLHNTVPDVIPDEEVTKPHDYAQGTTHAPSSDNETLPPIDGGDDKLTTSQKEKDFTISTTSKSVDITTSSSALDEIEKETATSTNPPNVVAFEVTTEKEYSDGDIPRTTSATLVKESSTEDDKETSEPELSTPSATISPADKEKESSMLPEQLTPSTTSHPLDENKLTTEPDHAQNTVAVAEEDSTHPHSHIPTTTAQPAEKETYVTTAEPDRGLNTIPAETYEKTSYKPSLPELTTLSEESIGTEPSVITDETQTQGIDIKSTVLPELITPLPESIVTKADQFTITTEPSFRKEDDGTIATEKPKETETTTVKSEFVDEGLIPTSSHDDKIGTSSEVPTTEDEFTTSIPEYVTEKAETVESKQTTTESTKEISGVTEILPEKVSAPSSEQDGDIPSSTEKLTEITPLLESHEEPSRIPGEGDCLLNGITYRNNSVVPSSNNCHTGCRCASSIIKCDPIICSPPPDYMDNCQSIYDSPDSCCPTFVCDHPRETVPPQSDNQMSGTESPMPSPTIECRGDQCEISQPTKQPIGPPESCTSGNCLTGDDHKATPECDSHDCGDISHIPDISLPTVEHSEKCSDGKCEPESCADGKCQLPQTQVSPVTPCEGEQCEKTDEIVPDLQQCKNGEDCKTLDKPAVETTPCVGESCNKIDCGDGGCGTDVNATPPDQQQQSCKEENGCKPQNIPMPECTGDEPCRRKEISASDTKPPISCDGPSCINEKETTVAQSVDLSTELPKNEHTPAKESTEPVEKATELPDYHISKPIDKEIPVKDTQDMNTYTTEGQTAESVTSAGVQKEKPVSEDEVTKEPKTDVEKKTEIPTTINEVESTELPALSTEEDTEKPIHEENPIVDEVITKAPAISSEDDENKPAIDEEITKKPDADDKGDQEKPVEDNKEKPVVDEEITKKPDSVDEDDKEKPVVDTEITKKPDIVDEDDKVKPVVDEEITKKPYIVDEDDKEKPVVDEEITKKPDILEEDEKEKPVVDEEITKKPDIVDSDDKEKPMVDEEITKKPDIVDSDDKEKPMVDEEITKQPDFVDDKETPVLDEEITKKPDIIDADDKEKPLVDKESTKKPDIVDEDDKEKPVVDEEITKKPDIIDEDDKEKPVIDEEITKKPDIVDEDDKEKPVVDEDITKKPDIIDADDKEKPLVDEKSTKKPDIVDEDGKEKPAVDEKITKQPDFVDDKETPVIDEEITKKPDIIDADDKEKPLVDKESTKKPDIVDEDDKEKPVVDEEITKKPDIIDEDDEEKPVIDEEITKKPDIVEEDDKEKPVVDEDITKKPDIVDEDDKEKPVVDEEITKKPDIIDADDKEKPVIDEEITKKPDIIDEDDKEKPMVDEEITKKPDIVEEDDKEKPVVDEDITKKPDIVDEDNKEKPVVDEEITKKPDIIDADDKEKPLVDEESTKKPDIIDEDGKEKPVVDEEITKKPDIIDEDDKEKPVIDEEITKKPDIVEEDDKEKPVVDEDITKKPDIVDEDITKKPDIVDEDDKEKPVVDEEITKKPDIIDADDKEKPVIDEEITKKPDIVDEDDKEKPLVDEDSTKEPDIVDADGKEKPIIDEEITKKPGIVDKDDKETPVVDEEITKKPDIIDTDDKEKPVIDEEITKKPDIVDEGDKEKPVVDEEIKKKPDIVDEDNKEKPLVDDESTKKPDIVDADDKEKPIIDEEITKKPDTVGEDDKEKHMVDEEGKKKPDVIEEESTTNPFITDKEITTVPGTEKTSTDAPAIIDQVNSDTPAVVDEDTEKPSLIDEDKPVDVEIDVRQDTEEPGTVDNNTEKPDLVNEDDTEKPAVVEMQSTKKPTYDEGEGVDLPVSVVEEDTKKPEIIDEESSKTPQTDEYTMKPFIIKEESTAVPDNNEDVDTKNPVIIDEGTEEPTIIEKEEPMKPAIIDDDTKAKPDLAEQDSTKTPVIVDEGTEKPGVHEDGTEEPSMFETEEPDHKDDAKKPVLIEDKEKDISVVDKEDSKPSVIDGEVTDKPAFNEVESTTTDEEEGSGTEIPKAPHSTEPEQDVKSPEITAQVTEDSDTEIEKTTKTPDSQTTVPKDVVHLYTTESNAAETIDVSTSPQETPEMKVTETDESYSKEPVIDDHSRTPEITTESHFKQEMTIETAESDDKVTISEQNVEITTSRVDTTDDFTMGHDFISGEPALITEAPESPKTSESVEKTTTGLINEQEVSTDTSEIESPTTKATDTDQVMIEPQDGIKPDKPELLVTSKLEEESSTKIYEDDKIKPIPESHVTEAISTSPEYEKSDGVTDVSGVKAEHKPVEIKTDRPDIPTSHKEETVTEEYSVTEPIRKFTEIEDPSVTGQEDKATGYPEGTTEHYVPSGADKIDESENVDITTSEKPPLTEMESDLPVKNLESDKHVTKTPVQDYQIPEAEKEKPTNEFESPATEIPISVVTESQQEPGMEITQQHATTAEDINKITGPYVTEPLITESHETSTKSGEQNVKDFQTITTDIPQTSDKEGATDTTESNDGQGEKKPTIPDIQNVTTDLSIEDVHTEFPGVQTSSEAPQSLVTEQKESFGEQATVSSIPKEESSHRPELLTTQSEAISKTPEEYVSDQKEIKTEVPVHVTETVEVSTKETGLKITHQPEEVVTEKQDTATTLRESPTVTEEIDQIEVIKSTEHTSPQTEFSETTPYLIELEEHTHKIIEDFTTVSPTEEVHSYKPADDTSTSLPFVEEHSLKPIEDSSTLLPSEKEHTQKPVEDISTSLPHEEDHSYKPAEDISTSPPSQEEHSYKPMEDISTSSPFAEEYTPKIEEHVSTISPFDKKPQISELTTKKSEEEVETSTKEAEGSTSLPEDVSEKVSQSVPLEETTPAVVESVDEKDTDDHKKYTTTAPTQITEESLPVVTDSEKFQPTSESDITVPTEKEISTTEKPSHLFVSHEVTAPEDEFIFSPTKATTIQQGEDIVTPEPDDKLAKPDEKPKETSEPLSSTTTEVSKPSTPDLQPTDEMPVPDEDGHFPTGGTSGYGEPDYVEEDQAFGPGTCRYGGKVYVSAQQIPRDDPCDFCFCFRSDIICLQQSCPPPIHGCHEEPIQGFCCPRYECPVSMATTVNVTTTTTTTTTTLPPHFPTHSYKGAAQRRGCQIKGHTYKVGEVVRSSSGPCLHCTCGGDGQMKCDPKACTPEPMLRQMIAAAVSAKRRR